MPHSILVVDDDPHIRDVVRFALEKTGMTISIATDGNEALRQFDRNVHDLVVLDIGMPDKNGIDTLRVIRQMRPEQGVLILSGYPESQYAINLLRAGANGYLNKDCEPDEIVRAIRSVARGHRYLSEAVADTLANSLDKPAATNPHEQLSQREFQIFCKLASGQIPTDIAGELLLADVEQSPPQLNPLADMDVDGIRAAATCAWLTASTAGFH